MCTIGAIKMGGKFFLFKNRDKIEPEKEYIERKDLSEMEQ